uniref:Xylanolytic transcriptional activator regulatory domain-containing protein n=1 Tax=Bionectria ochroleuca TaxID=29856 RepID=A0A8H7TMX9_BIOOC
MLVFGEGLSRSLCQIEGLLDPSTTDHGDHVYAPDLTRLTELLVEPQGVILVESVDEEMESASDYNSANLVDCPVQTTAANPDHYAFIIGYNLPDVNPRAMHPSPSQIPFYWQTFVENVEPLIKIFHIPSMNKLIREMQRSIRFLSPSKEAFMFAMYFAAVVSMTPNEVQELLDEDKETLAAKYRLATEKALAKAEFMSSSDLMTLQAFVLFLFCLREREQSRFTWTMTALAVRIAQGIGIHRVRRDNKLPPYDTEISLRLWLSVWLLDLRTALDQGTDWLIPDDVPDAALPLNINDSDLGPASVEYPLSRTGMTDMAPTLVKHEIGSLLKKLPRLERESEGIRPSSEPDWDEMERIAITYKKNVEEKYLHNCVDDEYFQWLTALNTRLFFAKVPLLFHHPVLSSDARSTLSPAVRDRLLTASIETLECSYAVVAISASLRWSRLFRTSIHWHAIAIILEELCLRSNKTEIAQRAWKAIELALDCWGSFPTSQHADELWKSLIKLMRTAKKRREANQSLYAQERTEAEPSPSDSSMPEIWALANSETQLSWPTDYSAGYLYEDLDEVLIDDTGASLSEVID